jgi:predicted metal-dependent hydrolase
MGDEAWCKGFWQFSAAHENQMVHLIEPKHNERFVAMLQLHYPTWREARAELDELPLAAQAWSVRNG